MDQRREALLHQIKRNTERIVPFFILKIQRMATTRNEHFILSNKDWHKDFEFYLNAKGEIFAQELGDSGYESFFIITKEDWEELKSFIDDNFLG